MQIKILIRKRIPELQFMAILVLNPNKKQHKKFKKNINIPPTIKDYVLRCIKSINILKEKTSKIKNSLMDFSIEYTHLFYFDYQTILSCIFYYIYNYVKKLKQESLKLDDPQKLDIYMTNNTMCLLYSYIMRPLGMHDKILEAEYLSAYINIYNLENNRFANIKFPLEYVSNNHDPFSVYYILYKLGNIVTSEYNIYQIFKYNAHDFCKYILAFLPKIEILNLVRKYTNTTSVKDAIDKTSNYIDEILMES